MTMRMEDVFIDYVKRSTGSIDVYAETVTEYDGLLECLEMLKIDDVWSDIYEKCFSAIREGITVNGKRALTLARTDHLFFVYPQKCKKASRLIELLSGGYALMQKNMGVQKSIILVFLPRKISEEETYTVSGILRLGFSFVSTQQLWEGLYALGHLLLAGKHNTNYIFWVYNCAKISSLSKEKMHNVIQQIDTLIDAYISAETIAAIGVSPYLHHLIWAEQDDLALLCCNAIDFCSEFCNAVMENECRESAYMTGSFFHFLSEKMDMEYYECFLRLLRIFRDGAVSFRKVVEEATFTRWEILEKEWAHEMYAEFSAVFSPVLTLV